MTRPLRIQLSRKKSWRMPPNTVKVDRSTKWGNPFIVGVHGTREYCVKLFRYLMAGMICLSFRKHADKQTAAYKHIRHTAASLLLDAGADEHTVGTILKHSDPRSTKRYTHLMLHAKRKAIGRLK
jgi:integrase